MDPAGLHLVPRITREPDESHFDISAADFPEVR